MNCRDNHRIKAWRDHDDRSLPAEDVEALALVIIEGVWSALQLGCELPPEKRPRVRAMLKQFVAVALAGLMEKYR